MAVTVVDHPLVRHKLGILRRDDTGTSDFRRIANEIAQLLVYEASKNFVTEKKVVQGWAGPVEVDCLQGKKVTIVPILRAGLGLMDGVLSMLPGAKISVVGLYRNEETLEPVEYYAKFASALEERLAIRRGARHICSLHLVSAPEGLEKVTRAHPDVDIYTAAIDDHLNENGYIIPGLGDAGDRIFGTR